jgi:hypothetical protein
MTKTATPHLPLDDDPMPMTMGERVTWAYGVLATLTAIAYFAIVLPRLADTPVSEIQWQVPMLIAIGVTVVGTIVATIISAIVAAIITRDVEQASDLRDTQISRRGDRVNFAITGGGIALVLGLAMLEVAPFFLGSTLFAVGTIGAIGASVSKIRAYRVTFDG